MITAAEITVFLFAAGRGNRMRALTDNTPKPLLEVRSKTLIEHHLLRIHQQGFKSVVINLAYLGQQIKEKLGDGSQYGLSICYSDESSSGPLETAGGLRKALPLIESDFFITINADIFTDYPFSNLLMQHTSCAHLVVVPNPPHNPNGDFSFSHNEQNPKQNSGLLHSLKALEEPSGVGYTYAGIAGYQKSIFENLEIKKSALAPLFHTLAAKNELHGEIFQGVWHDIGTPERLLEINASLKSN